MSKEPGGAPPASSIWFTSRAIADAKFTNAKARGFYGRCAGGARMANAAAFGKKKSAAATLADIKPRPPAALPTPDPLPPEEFNPEIAGYSAVPRRMPYLTFGLIAILALVFRGENIPAFDLGQLLSPNGQWLLAAGGLSGSAVLRNQEWWARPSFFDGASPARGGRWRTGIRIAD